MDKIQGKIKFSNLLSLEFKNQTGLLVLGLGFYVLMLSIIAPLISLLLLPGNMVTMSLVGSSLILGVLTMAGLSGYTLSKEGVEIDKMRITYLIFSEKQVIAAKLIAFSTVGLFRFLFFVIITSIIAQLKFNTLSQSFDTMQFIGQTFIALAIYFSFQFMAYFAATSLSSLTRDPMMIPAISALGSLTVVLPSLIVSIISQFSEDFANGLNEIAIYIATIPGLNILSTALDPNKYWWGMLLFATEILVIIYFVFWNKYCKSRKMFYASSSE